MKGERGESNPTREELDRYICQNPGSSFNLIKIAFRLNPGTLRYHLEYLENENRIKMVRKGRARCYFPDYLARFKAEGKGGSELNKMQKRVHSLILENPGITRKQIISSLDISRETLSSTISELKGRKMILETPKGKEMVLEVISRKRLAGEIIAVLVDKILEDEMDMESFRMIKEKVESELLEDSNV